MARYIDADALIAEMHNVILEDGEDRRTFYEVIERQPTADVVERKRGEWIFNPSDAIKFMSIKPKCSECGFGSADCGNYCSNCGADMRKEETDG